MLTSSIGLKSSHFVLNVQVGKQINLEKRKCYGFFRIVIRRTTKGNFSFVSRQFTIVQEGNSLSCDIMIDQRYYATMSLNVKAE